MDQHTLAHLLHGIQSSLEKVAAEGLPSPEPLINLAPEKPKFLSRENLSNIMNNPYMRAAAPGAIAGGAAGLLGAVGGNGSWYTPALGAAIGGLGTAGLHGAIQKGWIPEQYAQHAQNIAPGVIGGGILGSQLFDNQILGTIGGAALGGGAQFGANALMKRFGGLKK